MKTSASSQNQSPTQSQSSNKTKRILLCVLLSLVLLFVGGLSGYAICFYAGGSPAYTLGWVKDMVRKHYYLDLPEEQLKAAQMDDLFGYNGAQAILDNYSKYYTPQQYEEQKAYRAGNQEGAGLSFVYPDGKAQIYRVNGNSPAEQSGLRSGMYVHAYGNSAQSLTPFNSSEFSSFLNGLTNGQSFVLQASESAQSQGQCYTLKIQGYTQNYVFYADAQYGYRFTGEEAESLTKTQTWLSFLPQDTAYLRLDAFYGDAAEQIEEVLEIFEQTGKSKLILDLRNNGGGLTSVLCDIAQYFCMPTDGTARSFPVSLIEYKGGRQSVYTASRNRYLEFFTPQTQITVLANVNTASASEALIGAMLDYQTLDYEDIFLAQIDGVAKTYGKGIMQRSFENVLTGAAVKLTTATLRWPVSNRCIQGVGITPEDGAMPVFSNGYVDYNDGMLQQIITDYFA
ncbi:MAG: hypothetical protein J6S22_01455 [Clostridia bacterium]|nr:hypothetical protein [Clostridia bacterium]